MSRRIDHRRSSIRSQSRGVSLIEALLALVVMSLGMLAVVGVQATLRSNGDLSRQRAEAVRLAQEGIETWRTFTSLTAVAGQVDYTDIISDGPDDVSPPLANAVYLRTRIVSADALNGSPPLKTLAVTVQWTDRTGAPQQVQLFTTVARIAPAIAASLSVPPNGAPARQPLGRNKAIPRGAVPGVGDTSSFAPPATAGLPATTLIFNNLNGLITCIVQAGDPNCVPDYVGQLITGYIHVPLNKVFTVRVDYNSEGTAGNAEPAAGPARAAKWNRSEQCFVADPVAIGAVLVAEYFCVVQLDKTQLKLQSWNGKLVFGPAATFAPDLRARDAALLRACRYVPVVAEYSDINRPLVLQNYKLMPADGDCPAGTELHQP